MAHMDSERILYQQPGLRKEEKYETHCSVTWWHGTQGDLWLHTLRSPPGCREMLFPYQRDTTPPQITKGIPHHHKSLPPRGSQAEVGPLLTGGGVWTSACLHHLSTGAGQGCAQKRVPQTLWVQVASLETKDRCSPDNRNSQLVLTYPGVLSVSIQIAGGSFIPHLWRCQGGTKPMPPWSRSAGLSRPGF